MTSLSVTLDVVTESFRSACFGSNPQIQQQAMKLIQNYEDYDGFIEAIIHIIQNSSNFNSEMRLLASISLKNVIGRRWLTRGNSCRIVNAGEKSMLKRFSIQYLHEPENKVAIQLAILASKIARHDWPEQWPDLFPSLCQAVTETTDLSKQKRLFYIIYEVIREVGEKNMPVVKKALIEVSTDVFAFMVPIWNHYCQQFIAALESTYTDLSQINNYLEHLVIIIKILQKCLLKGYVPISANTKKNVDLNLFYNLFVEYLIKFVAFIEHHKSKSGKEDYCDMNECYEDIFSFLQAPSKTKHISSSDFYSSVIIPLLVHLVKVMSSIPPELLKSFPLEIAPYVYPFLQFYQTQLFREFSYEGNKFNCTAVKLVTTPSNSFMCTAAIQFIYKALNLLKFHYAETVQVSSEKTESDSNKSGTVNQHDINCHLLKEVVERCEKFFDDKMVISMLYLIVNRLSHYSDHEMNDWMDAPETFYLMQQNLSECDSLKTASEMLYLGLVESYPELVSQHILPLLQDTNQQMMLLQLPVGIARQASEESILKMWESVYLCAGLSVSLLSQYINALDWLRYMLGPLITSLVSQPSLGRTRTGQQTLLNRLLWLISCWIYQFDGSVINDLLSIIFTVLNLVESFDLVCVLTSLETLQSILRSDHFKVGQHGALLSQFIHVICNLTLNRLEENETRLLAIDTLTEILDYISSINFVALLPELGRNLELMWIESEPNSPLRVSVLEATTRAVRRAGAHSYQLHAMALPLVHFSTSGSIETAFLVRSGISLWLAVLKNTKDEFYNSKMEELYASRYMNVIYDDLIADDDECFKDVMAITEAYCVLGGPGKSFLYNCAQILSEVYTKLLDNVPPRSVPFLLRPLEVLFVATPADTTQFLMQSRILFTIARTCAASIPELTAALTLYTEADVALISYLTLLARIYLTFKPLVQELGCMLAHSISISVASQTSASSSSASSKLDDQSRRQLVVECPNVPLANYCPSPESTLIWHGWQKLMIDKFDSVGYARGGVLKRRVICVALLSSFPTQEPLLVDIFPDVISLAISLIQDENTLECQRKYSKLIDDLIVEDDDMSGWFDFDDENDKNESGDGSNVMLSPMDPLALIRAAVQNSTKQPYYYNVYLNIEKDPGLTSPLLQMVRAKLNQMRELFGKKLDQSLEDIFGIDLLL